MTNGRTVVARLMGVCPYVQAHQGRVERDRRTSHHVYPASTTLVAAATAWVQGPGHSNAITSPALRATSTNPHSRTANVSQRCCKPAARLLAKEDGFQMWATPARANMVAVAKTPHRTRVADPVDMSTPPAGRSLAPRHDSQRRFSSHDHVLRLRYRHPTSIRSSATRSSRSESVTEEPCHGSILTAAVVLTNNTPPPSE